MSPSELERAIREVLEAWMHLDLTDEEDRVCLVEKLRKGVEARLDYALETSEADLRWEREGRPND